MMQQRFSIVEYYGEGSGHRCGYCKGSDSSFSHGMWSHLLTAQDYQDLINRGWRRSGKYCYKPNNKKTCCPLYTIKCDAINFKLSKTHKKILKRMNRFLKDGSKSSEVDQGGERTEETGNGTNERDCSEGGHEMFMTPNTDKTPATLCPMDQITEMDCVDGPIQSCITNVTESTKHARESQAQSDSKAGPDPSKPLCKKAKELRLERKRAKLAEKGITLPSPVTISVKANQEKTLEQFLAEEPLEPKHKLKLKLIPSSKGVTEQSLKLYKKYQMTVHNDSPSKLTEAGFRRFLSESPIKFTILDVTSADFKKCLKLEYDLYRKYQTLVHDDPPSDISEFEEFLVHTPMEIHQEPGAPYMGYGSFHQQYWLDNRLIAVAVIDILPQCVSSVYFFYDPDFSFLSLGTYASLRELALTRELQLTTPSLSNYYMGFYIHSCPKMRYKGKLYPSYLLCPEVYTWHLLDDSIRNRLDVDKYQRFNPDAELQEAELLQNNDLLLIKVLYGRNIMHYGNYLEHAESEDTDEVLEYGTLVGRTCSRRIVLFRS